MAAAFDPRAAFDRVRAEDPQASPMEAAYWMFDAMRSGRLSELRAAGLGATDERRAFKLAAGLGAESQGVGTFEPEALTAHQTETSIASMISVSENDMKVAIECLEKLCGTDCSMTVEAMRENVREVREVVELLANDGVPTHSEDGGEHRLVERVAILIRTRNAERAMVANYREGLADMVIRDGQEPRRPLARTIIALGFTEVTSDGFFVRVDRPQGTTVTNTTLARLLPDGRMCAAAYGVTDRERELGENIAPKIAAAKAAIVHLVAQSLGFSPSPEVA